MKTTIKWEYSDGGKAQSKCPNEKQDCVIRAVSLFLDRPYDDVHAFFASRGRKCKHKTRGTINHLQAMGLTGQAVDLTINQFLKIHSQGVYYCHIRGHAFTVKNGIIFDTFPSGKKTKIDYFIEKPLTKPVIPLS